LGWVGAEQWEETQRVQGALVKLLADQDAPVRIRAAEMLLGWEAHDEAALNTVAKALQDKDANIRMQATKTLQVAGLAALPLLEKAMKDENAEIRHEAVELYLSIHLTSGAHRDAYGEVVRDPIPMPLLLEALSDADPRLRRLSSRLLADLAFYDPCAARPAVPALTKALKDGERAVQMLAVKALLRLGQKNPDFLQILLEAAKDEGLSHEAFGIVESMGPSAKDAVLVLIKMLEHSDGNVSVRAARMLGKIGPPAVPDLIKLMETKKDKAAHMATSALSEMGAKAKDAVPVLILRLKYLQGPNNESEKAFVAEILGRMGPDARAAVPTLVTLMQDKGESDYARVQYIRAIRSIGPGGPEAIPDFLQALKSGEPSVRDEVRWIFPLIGPEGIPPLLKVIANAQEPSAFRVSCIRVLADMRPDPKKAAAVLVPLLDDGDADIRSAARGSLARIEADAAKKAKSK
jgi:HEAT repeat protein